MYDAFEISPVQLLVMPVAARHVLAERARLVCFYNSLGACLVKLS